MRYQQFLFFLCFGRKLSALAVQSQTQLLARMDCWRCSLATTEIGGPTDENGSHLALTTGRSTNTLHPIPRYIFILFYFSVGRQLHI